jgi:hypothetical protein
MKSCWPSKIERRMTSNNGQDMLIALGKDVWRTSPIDVT